LPRIEEGMRRSGRSRANFDVFGGGFVITGPDAETVAQGMRRARQRIAFYGSTRSYAPILALHGLEELGAKLHARSVQGRWDEMAAEVPDEVVRIFAVCGTYGEIAQQIADRFGGLADAIEVNFPAGASAGLKRELLAEIHRIPHPFEGFDTGGSSDKP
jgi:alkanesulfonate monooxygenase SsuD/methylene tetrahydromethanopterin reductase-like flavin-dependent oxidoreductase (luciferase family)